MAKDQFGPLPPGGHYTQPYSNGRLLAAIMAYHLTTRDDLWLEAGRKIVDGLWGLAIDRGEYAYFGTGQYGPGEVSDPNAPIPHPWMTMPFGWTLMGLAQFARLTGYEPAGELAAKLSRYFRDHAGFFGTDGEFLPEEPKSATDPQRAHLHGHAYPLLGIMEYGLASGDEDTVEFVRKGYEYAKQYCDTLIGYVPEFIDPRTRRGSELCGVADMIALGLKLIDAGAGDYWDEVDRWTRNMFAEGQLTRSDWMYRVGAGQPHAPIDETYQTDELVGERNIGGFAGWPSANDFFGSRYSLGHNNIFMHCCTGNATRAIYYIWEHILHHEDGNLRVNLLLNRGSPWADVDSYIPYEGQVDVRIKQACNLSVRIPEWVKPDDVRGQVNDEDRRVGWDGRYAVVGALKPGDVATLSFPIFERKDTVWIEKEKYTLVRKGNEVVAIDPPGRYAPLFQRDHYRENQVRWHKVSRFVADDLVDW